MSELVLGPRFWRHVRFGSCFEWLGRRSHNGYGQIWVNRGERNGRKRNGCYYRVHRLVWEVLNGPIPEGMCVLHYCDNRVCVNPRHLWLGTARDNDDDRVAKDRSAKGEANGQARLTTTQVIALRGDARSGLPHKALAQAYGISMAQVGRIVARKKWAHV